MRLFYAEQELRGHRGDLLLGDTHRNSNRPRQRQKVGKALECAAFLELRRRYGEVFYWRDRGEVDFVVLEDGGEAVPVQVSQAGATGLSESPAAARPARRPSPTPKR